MRNDLLEILTERIPIEGLNCLMIPPSSNEIQTPIIFALQHTDLIVVKA